PLSTKEVTDFSEIDKISNIKPMLSAPLEAGLSSDQLLFAHKKAALALKERGYKSVVLAADDDGYWQRSLSPRYSSAELTLRMIPLQKTYEALALIFDDLWLSLTLEELAPGGFDATDGLYVLNKFEELGLKRAIIAAGTRDFLPLYMRRATQKKNSLEKIAYSHEPDLATARWAVLHTKLEIWPLALIADRDEALSIGKRLGIAGLIKRVWDDGTEAVPYNSVPS
ncbi:MAG TPA: hypothetical protein VEK06_00230, partial [Myxococcota bacterium]|nr:hypothetical protein [Myxococcota bacterium]